MSKTQEAIALVDSGVSPFAAAKQVGIQPNTLYVALKRKREKEEKAAGKVHCPTCGTLVDPEQLAGHGQGEGAD